MDDNLKVIMEWVDVLKWPLVVLIIFIFTLTYFRGTFKSLLSKIKKVKIAGIDTDINIANQEKEAVTLAGSPSPSSTNNNALGNKRNSLQYVNRILAFFSQKTIDFYKNGIEKELHVSEITSINEKTEILDLYSQALVINLNFERTYNRIFGSQMFFLQHLNEVGIDTKSNLKHFYDDASVRYPELYNSYDYDKYIAFMIDSHLATINNNDLEITPLGNDFLKFIVETQKTKHKNY